MVRPQVYETLNDINSSYPPQKFCLQLWQLSDALEKYNFSICSQNSIM